MKYIAIIINKQTNETRKYEFEEDDPIGIEWQWIEGNYGCDCNRGNFFRNGEFGVMDECGGDKYKVPYILKEDGSKILIDNLNY